MYAVFMQTQEINPTLWNFRFDVADLPALRCPLITRTVTQMLGFVLWLRLVFAVVGLVGLGTETVAARGSGGGVVANVSCCGRSCSLPSTWNRRDIIIQTNLG